MSTTEGPGRPTRGRPGATTHAAIEQAAFRLFSELGFDRTTLDDIAAEVGVSRRTILRYYESKSDIPWGQFDLTLARFRGLLDSSPEEQPLHQVVHRAVVEFNRFPDDARPTHRERMRLILETPALLAHSALRYAEWRQVIADYVARRTGCAVGDLLPRSVGHVSLALAVSAYEAWLADAESCLIDLLEEAMAGLKRFLGA